MGGPRSHSPPRMWAGPPADLSSQRASLPAPGRIRAKFRPGPLLAAACTDLLGAQKWLSWLRVQTVPGLRFVIAVLKVELQPEDAFSSSE